MGKIKGKPTFGIDNRIGLNLKQDIKTIKEVFGRNLTFGELAKGYIDDSSKGGGVTAWNGKLNLSPKYQRSFVRDGNGKEAKRWRTRLINSIVNGLPIGEIYFATCEDNEKVFQESFEQLDGKQRMMTVLGYINGYFCLDYESERGIQKNVYFEKLKKSFPEIAQKILDYEPVIYVCCGDRESKKEWFDTINQPNSPLTDQEIRNAIYNGTFIDDIKMHFAKTKATAVSTFENNEFLFNEESKYLFSKYFGNIDPVRQDVVEGVLNWVSYRDYGNEYETEGDRICAYMECHMNEKDASDAISFYKDVIDWVNDIFFHGIKITRIGHMPNIQWGRLYVDYKDLTKNSTEKEKKYISNLCQNLVNILCKSGGKCIHKEGTKLYNVYEWALVRVVINGKVGEIDEEDEKMMLLYMSPRLFTQKDKVEMYYKQHGYDPIDGKKYELKEMESHHIIPWYLGGPTVEENHVLLSKENHKQLDILGYTPKDIMDLKKKLIEEIEQEK